jgi:hypothetical protein
MRYKSIVVKLRKATPLAYPVRRKAPVMFYTDLEGAKRSSRNGNGAVCAKNTAVKPATRNHNM